MPPATERSGVQSIDRAFGILRALAVAPSGLTELAARAKLPKSTVARILATLDELGAVTRDEDGRTYRVGSTLAELAGAVDASAALATAVRPHLHWLSHQLGEAAGFSVPSGYSIHYLVQIESPNPVQVRDYTGLTVPMHVGPSGLCVMANWPQPEIDRYLRRRLEAYTPHTVVKPELIRNRLEEIREAGYCWIYEEFAEGINSVAAPVYDNRGRPLGAIHVHGPSYRFPAEGATRAVARKVVEAAARFTARNE
ncbi:MAG TPA: IclR family transcriptional regulator [Acidimicrobiia bacterium]|nr:IclR family transcriptional regulator [Acidimicrobiia bacterium]